METTLDGLSVFISEKGGLRGRLGPAMMYLVLYSALMAASQTTTYLRLTLTATRNLLPLKSKSTIRLPSRSFWYSVVHSTSLARLSSDLRYGVLSGANPKRLSS